jgi:hypothetical protein
VTESGFGRPEAPAWSPTSGAEIRDDEFDGADEVDADEFDDETADADVLPIDFDEAAKARLAAALAAIDAVMGKNPADQVTAFTDAQQTLQATLARIDTN